LSVLKVITRREGGGRLWKSRSDFQGAVGAFSASMAAVQGDRALLVSRAPRAIGRARHRGGGDQARQSSWQRPRRLPLGCRAHPGPAASLPPPRAALRTPRGRPRSLPHGRLRPHHLALPKEGVLKRTLRICSRGNWWADSRRTCSPSDVQPHLVFLFQIYPVAHRLSH